MFQIYYPVSEFLDKKVEQNVDGTTKWNVGAHASQEASIVHTQYASGADPSGTRLPAISDPSSDPREQKPAPTNRGIDSLCFTRLRAIASSSTGAPKRSEEHTSELQSH